MLVCLVRSWRERYPGLENLRYLSLIVLPYDIAVYTYELLVPDYDGLYFPRRSLTARRLAGWACSQYGRLAEKLADSVYPPHLAQPTSFKHDNISFPSNTILFLPSPVSPPQSLLLPTITSLPRRKHHILSPQQYRYLLAITDVKITTSP